MWSDYELNQIYISIQGLQVFFYFQTLRERKVLEVHIDKGMTDGQKIVFSGEGDQEPDIPPGDIIIVLDEQEHEVFK